MTGTTTTTTTSTTTKSSSEARQILTAKSAAAAVHATEEALQTSITIIEKIQENMATNVGYFLNMNFSVFMKKIN